ncbi:uncharacterized protein V6R79_012069 [Siganus canaliculatus]
MCFQVAVQNHLSLQRVVDVCPTKEHLKNMTVSDLKKKIIQEFGSDEDLRLVFKSLLLEEEDSLGSLQSKGFKHMSTIRALPRTEEGRRRRRDLFLEQMFEDETPEEEEEQKCYDPRDNTLTFVDEEDHLDFLCEEFESLRAAMSCGHAVTPMSLTQWCRRQLDEGKNKFVCGQPDCKAEWSYDEVRKMALLTSEEAKYFRTKLDSNIANSNPGHRQCPGCKSYVRRTDPNNLSLECPKCTAEKKRSYRFCWQCLKEWSGPAPRSDHCDNEDCVSPQIDGKMCFQVTVQHLSGNRVVDVCQTKEQLKNVTVLDLKKKINQEYGSGEDLRLVFKSIMLEDQVTLESLQSAGLKHMSTIMTLPRLRGGSS